MGKIPKFGVVIIILILLIVVFAGVYLVGKELSSSWFDSSKEEISAPSWEPGQYWVYSFTTPEVMDAGSRMVVSHIDDPNYMVGIASRIDAQRHAVLNYNPMLGRITVDSLETYEEGVPQPLFSFPLEKDNSWSFSFFKVQNFNAKVKSIENLIYPEGETTIVNIEASASTGEKLTYSYDRAAEWIRHLTLVDSEGNYALQMNLVSYGTNFTGEIYFVRGVDVFDEEYSSSQGSPLIDIYDTFIDQGHPNWGPFDSLIYYYEVYTQDASSGTLTVRDHRSETKLRRVFGPNILENTLGKIPSEAGEWSVTVSLTGDSYLRLRMAGGIEYIWTVK